MTDLYTDMMIYIVDLYSFTHLSILHYYQITSLSGRYFFDEYKHSWKLLFISIFRNSRNSGLPLLILFDSQIEIKIFPGSSKIIFYPNIKIYLWTKIFIHDPVNILKVFRVGIVQKFANCSLDTIINYDRWKFLHILLKSSTKALARV